jgi:hypothetical protein
MWARRDGETGSIRPPCADPDLVSCLWVTQGGGISMTVMSSFIMGYMMVRAAACSRRLCDACRQLILPLSLCAPQGILTNNCKLEQF